jgi:hypothetical protein
MSVLTDAFKIISEWLEQNQPELFASLQPGLSFSEIEALVNILLPARLPVEIYELYRWRNGTTREPRPVRIKVDGLICECDEGNFYIPFGRGRALETFSALYFCPLEFVGVFRNERVTLLEIFCRHDASFVMCSNEQKATSSLLCNEGEYYYGEVYPSATNLFLELAEAFNTGTIFMDEDILSIDTQKAEALSQNFGKHCGEYVDMGDFEAGCCLGRLSERL